MDCIFEDMVWADVDLNTFRRHNSSAGLWMIIWLELSWKSQLDGRSDWSQNARTMNVIPLLAADSEKEYFMRDCIHSESLEVSVINFLILSIEIPESDAYSSLLYSSSSSCKKSIHSRRGTGPSRSKISSMWPSVRFLFLSDAMVALNAHWNVSVNCTKRSTNSRSLRLFSAPRIHDND